MKRKLRKISICMMVIGLLYIVYHLINPVFKLTWGDRMNCAIYVVYIAIMIECFLYSY